MAPRGKKAEAPQASTSKVPITSQVSAGGPARWGGRINEEFLPELRFPQATKVYDTMRKNSPVVGGLMRAIEAAFRSTKWQWVPAEKTEEGELRALFLEQCFNDMDRPWSMVTDDILTMLPFGFAPMEQVFKLRRGRGQHPYSLYDDGMIGWRDLSLIPQDSISEWMYDENEPNTVVGIKQQNVNISNLQHIHAIEIPIEKVLNFRIKGEKNNPEGESVLRQAYRSWHFMTGLEVVEAISLERTGAGIPMITLPLGATTKVDKPSGSDEQAAQDVVRSIRADEQSGIVIPFGWTFDIVTSKNLRPELFDLAIKRHRSNLLISVLAAFLELGTARVGSFATAKVGRSFFEVALEGWVMAVEDIFNTQAIPLLFEMNGMFDGIYPKLDHTTTGGEGVRDIIEMIVELAKVDMIEGGDSTKTYIRDLLRLPKVDEEEEEEEGLGEDFDDEGGEPTDDLETVDDDDDDDDNNGFPPEEEEEEEDEEL